MAMVNAASKSGPQSLKTYPDHDPIVHYPDHDTITDYLE